MQVPEQPERLVPDRLLRLHLLSYNLQHFVQRQYVCCLQQDLCNHRQDKLRKQRHRDYIKILLLV